MRIAAISDTHNQHTALKIPECDILIHCGDHSFNGLKNEFIHFVNWFNDQHQAKHKIFIPGNHDFICQKDKKWVKEYLDILNNKNLHYLLDSQCVIDGIKFYGTPWTPYFHDWAFNGLEYLGGTEDNDYDGGPGRRAVADGDHPYLSYVYGKIPEDTNVLICHGPPRVGTLDATAESNHPGSNELKKAILTRPSIKYGLFGHIHEGYGSYLLKETKLFNVSTLKRDYRTFNDIVVFDYA